MKSFHKESGSRLTRARPLREVRWVDDHLEPRGGSHTILYRRMGALKMGVTFDFDVAATCLATERRKLPSFTLLEVLASPIASFTTTNPHLA
jgi:hypothetical protein